MLPMRFYLSTRVVLPVAILFANILILVDGFRNRPNFHKDKLVSRNQRTNPSVILPPLRSSIGNMFEAMKGLVTGPAAGPPSGFKDPANKSWEELKSSLYSLQTPEERDAIKIRESGRGKYSVKGNLRLFDAADGTVPRVILYRDSSAWCPYCQRVILVLEEKRIPYRVERVPMRCYGQKPAEFMRMVPSGLLPVVKIDGVVITESMDIIQALEDIFPESTALLPLSSDPKAKQVGPLLKLEREIFGAWLRWLTGTPMTDGMQRKNFESVLSKVETALVESKGPYFLGETVSLIDCLFAPFLERMAASLCYYKGFMMRRSPNYPAVEKWFLAMESRDSYANIKSDWYTHSMDLPPQVGTCWSIPEADTCAKEIDGRDGSWTLPLKTEPGVEPFDTSRDVASAKREAAAQLIVNHEAVVKFACRALGQKGLPPVMAALSDPNATPNGAYLEVVDSALRLITEALLSATTDEDPALIIPHYAIQAFVAKDEVASALQYLQARVGVPRDLSFEAARQLRGYLGWFSSQLQKA